LPRRLQIEFSQVVQAVMDTEGKELTAQDLWQLFEREYGLQAVPAPVHRVSGAATGGVRLTADVRVNGQHHAVAGEGTGPIDAFVRGLNDATGQSIRVLDYHDDRQTHHF
jgi:2-isopropylmalate synthase